MPSLKGLAGQTAIYGLSSVIGRMLNYLLVPLYTSVFLPGEYGIVTELYAYAAFLNILFIYGMETAYFRFSSEKSNHNYFNLSVTSVFFSTLLLSGSIVLLSNPIAQLLEYPGKAELIRWLGIIIGIDAIVAIPFARLRQEGKAVLFALFKLSNITINIGLNLYFLVLCPWFLEANPNHFLVRTYNPEIGVGYVFLSNLIANGLYLLFFLPVWIKTRFYLDVQAWKRMMRYALPILVLGFAGVTNEMLSRAILKYRLPEDFYPGLSNIEVLGIFGACYKLSIFMALAVQAFRYSFEPFFFAKASNKNSPKLFSEVMTWFVIFGTFSWLLISVSLPFFAPIFLRQNIYLQALHIVPWLLGGGLFLGIFYNLSLWYKLTDKTILGAYISLIGAGVTFLMNWTLIPVLGYQGSALATFFTYLIMVVISYFWGKRYYPVPYDVLRILGYVTLAGLGISLFYLGQESLWSAMLIVLIFLILSTLFERRRFTKLKANNGGV